MRLIRHLGPLGHVSLLLVPGLAASAANVTTTAVQAAGTDWTAAIWRTNGAGTVVSPIAGNTYQCIPNGVAFGNGTANTRIRNPVVSGTVIFPGDSLTLNTDTELRMKQAAGGGPVLNFPGVGASPGLILNGGILNVGDDAVFSITGRIHVDSQAYICPGDTGGGAVKPLRGVNLTGQLSGTGTIFLFQAGTAVAQQISGAANTFSGPWILKAGWLQASGLNSLGTNSITVDPNYLLPLSGPILDVPGPAVFEPGYDLNSAGTLILTNGGTLVLHQNCTFSAVIMEGMRLTAGTHPFSELAASFPNNFGAGGSGSLTVQPYGPPLPLPPTFTTQPLSLNLALGSATQLVVTASGEAPLHYQWQKGTNNLFSNLNDSPTVIGSRSNILSFASLASSDSGDYRAIAANSLGSATSQVATVTVLIPDTGLPRVAVLNPPAGASLPSLSQIQVTFSKDVVGVAAEDLLINGTPANLVSGSGSNYLFIFSQPLPGEISVYWDVDNAISDSTGNPLDAARSWIYTLFDSIPPSLGSALPVPGATLAQVRQAQVLFTEPVFGITAADLLIDGIPATNVVGTGLGPYLFDFSPPAAGIVQFSWASSQRILDSASNLFNSGGWTVRLDSIAASAAITNILINEFLAANVSANGLADEDLELSDWIELFNRGSVPVNLAGWALTDDAVQPTKWSFPSTNIAPRQYLVVFASGKDRRVPGANLHTNFRLSSGGGCLGLYSPDLPPQLAYQYSPEYPEQRNAISYGLDTAGKSAYFTTPTPGAPNASATITGVVADVHLTVNHGFFDRPFNLLLTSETPGATILYTIDGSEPTLSGTITNGVLYTGPIYISRTTPLRAAAFAPNLLPSHVASQTYLFIEDIVHQPNNPAGYPTGNVWTPTPEVVQNGSRAYYQMDPVIVNDPQYSAVVRSGLLSIPTMSILSSIDGLFGPVNGIYTHPQSRSVGWERPCSMELIYLNASPGLQIDCGIQIQGGSQRDPVKNAKHSFRVNFKGDYGSKKLDYPFFPDSALASYNTLVLDGGINMWWHYVGSSSPTDQRYRAQCVRDQFTSDLMLALGQPSWRGVFYHLYLNGLYWGLHYVHERPDEAFAATYLGGTRGDYDVIRNTTAGLEVVAGDLQAWNTALALSNSGLTNNAQYVQLQQYVDIDNLIDYMIVNQWVGNNDWPWHNWYMIRRRVPGAGFQFIIWDTEHVLKGVNDNRMEATDAGSPGQIYSALRNNPEFRLRFADHIQKHFSTGGLFYTDPNPANALWDPAHPERNVPASLYMKRIHEIDTAIVDESARWGGYLLTTNYTRNDHWIRELNNLLGFTNTPGNTANYFPLRSANVLNQYRSIGLLPSALAPVLSQSGGIVPAGFALSMTNLNAGGRIYFTTNGTDPRAYGSGAVTPGALVYTAGQPVIISRTLSIKARVLNGSWSPLTAATFSVASLGVPIRITELMYHPIGGSAYEFIELQNVGSIAVDLSGFSFQGISYVFPNGATLQPGAVMVLGSDVDPAAFAVRYPGVAVADLFGGALSNTGERIALLDAQGNTVASVEYSNAGNWPLAADGAGYSLEIIDPNGDLDDPANWRASLSLNGSPGLVNPVSPLPSIRFNEVMAENAGAVTNGGNSPSWVELYNTATNPVSLANWSLAHSSDNRTFVFPSGAAVAGNGFMLLWCDSVTNAPGLHTGFALDRKGETLLLFNASSNRVDAFTFGLQITNYSVGRIGAGASWQLTLPTPAGQNTAATTGSMTNLTINEWMANSLPGAPDWLELYNRSATEPVALQGLYFSTSNAFLQFRSLSFIPPHGYVQLFADEKPGADHLNFKLPAAGDSISLVDPAGQTVDAVSFGPQVEGVAQGRLPDGTSTITTFAGTASPGAHNYINAYTGPVLNELMARNSFAVFDARGNCPDWLELYNPNSSPFDLAGMGLGANRSSSQWIFPAGTSISPHDYLLVWCDPSRPASANAGPDLNAGFALDATGGTVCLFNTNGQVADSVEWGFQIADLSIGRDGANWALLNAPTPGAANSSAALLGLASNLRLNEWMAAPISGNDWFELYNASDLPVSLAGLYLTDDPSIFGTTNFQLAPLSFVAARGWVRFEADSQRSKGPNHVSFALDSKGETIRLHGAALELIDNIDFGLQTAGVSQGRLPDGAGRIVSFQTTPTPAASNYLPLENVFINEVLTHTDPPLEDAIELYNQGPNDVPLGGWFISNSESDPDRYRIPQGVILPAHGYSVLYEYQFNSTNAFPFTLNSAHGDSVLLSETDAAGNLTGYRAQVSFGAAENGVSWGRFPTSTAVDFVPLTTRSFGMDSPSTLAQFRTGTGLTNGPAKNGPVAINEIMYHPVTPVGTNQVENAGEEYVELINVTPNTVSLYDLAVPANTWQLRGGINFAFPEGVILPPSGLLLIVGFDPAADPSALANFKLKYSPPTDTPIFGPFSGRLNNSSDTVELYRPDAPQTAPHPDAGFVPHILVDRVVYGSGSPWPADANGSGLSLQRVASTAYGNEPLNWIACSPTPGAANCDRDSDGDGLPDSWELTHGLDPYSALGNNGAAGDPDGDRFTNLQEFLAGTDPQNPQSCLRIESISTGPDGIELRFRAVAGHSYSVQYLDNLDAGNWLKLVDVAPPSTNRLTVLTDSSANGRTTRFYRLVTPRIP